ncbi:MAG: hypothetical protein AABZ30_00180 [Myxococcota bacterium]
MTRLALGPFLVFCACGADPIITPSRNLDRPVAVAFACVKLDVEGRVFATAPAADCAPDGEPQRRLYAFVANSTRGEIAVVDASRGRLLDLEAGSPGFRFLPVGELPADVTATADGCRVVTANFGSCDLGVVDALETIAPSGETPKVWMTTPTVGGAPLGARPRAIVANPHATPGACAVDAPYEAYVTFPSCGLLARIDLATGELVEALSVGEDGIRRVAAPSCPSECGAGAGCLSPRDGTCAVEGSALPLGLDLQGDGSRLVVAAGGAPYVGWVSLDPDSGAFVAFGTIPFSSPDAPSGASVVRISPPTDAGRFVYAVADDGTLRVLSLLDGRECETNVDARALGESVAPAEALCFGVGDPARPRRALAHGPGIEIAGDLPVDVSFAEIHCCRDPDEDGGCADDPERTVCPAVIVEGRPLSTIFYDGVYAFVATSRGLVYVVDVEDRFESALSGAGYRRESLPHSIRPIAQREDLGCADPEDGATDFRLRLPFVDGDGSTMRYGQEELRLGDSAFPGLLDTTACASGCALDDGEGVCRNSCGDECGATDDDHGILFPDPRAVESEILELDHEGVIPRTARSTGRVIACDEAASARPTGRGVCVRDVGAGFCGAGVEPGDIVELAGCAGDADCDPLLEICAFDPGTPAGLGGFCAPRETGELLPECRAVARSRREYRVAAARDDRLALELLPVRLRCEDDESTCGACFDQAEANDCVRVCAGDDDCLGLPCALVAGQRVCVAAPALSPDCFASLTRYQVRVGAGFRVRYGEDGEFFHRVVPDDGGACVIDASESRLLVSRIPLEPPPCEDTGVGGGAPSPNPCAETTRTLETLVHYANPRHRMTLSRVDRTPPRTPEAELVLRFDVRTPLDPLGVATGAYHAAEIYRAPDGFFYVVDVADTVPAGGVRGQLLRWDAFRAATDSGFVIR